VIEKVVEGTVYKNIRIHVLEGSEDYSSKSSPSNRSGTTRVGVWQNERDGQVRGKNSRADVCMVNGGVKGKNDRSRAIWGNVRG